LHLGAGQPSDDDLAVVAENLMLCARHSRTVVGHRRRCNDVTLDEEADAIESSLEDAPRLMTEGA
jgi:hypothetical protein